MRVRSFFGMCAVALVATVGCAELLGLDGLKDRTDGGSDATADVQVDSGSDVNACPLVHPPPQPAQDDPSDASVELFGVIRSIITQTDAGPPIGYDIDDVSTCCMGAPESCVPPVTTNKHCDEDGGRDNRGGEALAGIVALGIAGLNGNTLNDAIDGGAFSLAFAVQLYNGQPNDRQVLFTIYVSSGTVGSDGGFAHEARWDGTDLWSIDQSSTPGGADDAGIPYGFHIDSNAYVSNGTLVANITFPFFFGSGSGNGALTTITDAIVTGQIVLENGSFHIDDGQVSGRIRLTDLFALLHGVPNPFVPGTFICPGTSAYDYAKPLICGLADVNGDRALDNSGAPCDAISFSAGFTGVLAQPGPVVNPGNSPSPCLDAGIEKCP
jgi:hypothetical protein